MNRLIPLMLLTVALPAAAGNTPAPQDTKLYFVAPADGATVRSPVRVVFGLRGMGVAPAGVKHDKTGHHHLLVDTSVPAATAPIPKDDKHLHFGDGQTETTLKLPPGKHTLQLLLGDFAHVPHNPPVMSERIIIEVR